MNKVIEENIRGIAYILLLCIRILNYDAPNEMLNMEYGIIYGTKYNVQPKMVSFYLRRTISSVMVSCSVFCGSILSCVMF